MRWLRVGLLVCVVVSLAMLGTFETVPKGTTGTTRFDALIVLGCPANGDGSPSLEERERVMEAVREYRAGRASHVIFSGGAAYNRFVEADVMARLAAANGVPAEAIEEDRQARNTIENIFYSHAVMERHGWNSAEVISSPNHLPRAGLILEHWRFAWRTDAARWPSEYSEAEILSRYGLEVIKTARLRWFGFYASPFLPGS